MDEYKRMWTAEELQKAALPGLRVNYDEENYKVNFYNDEGEKLLQIGTAADDASEGLVVQGNYICIKGINSDEYVFQVTTDDTSIFLSNYEKETLTLTANGTISHDGENGVQVHQESKEYTGELDNGGGPGGTYTLKLVYTYDQEGSIISAVGALAINLTSAQAGPLLLQNYNEKQELNVSGVISTSLGEPVAIKISSRGEIRVTGENLAVGTYEGGVVGYVN